MSGQVGDSNIVPFESLAPNVQSLLLESIEAKKLSYSIYSNFAVGACLECEDGTRYKGCNVENAVQPLSICAERTAMVKAVSEGRRKFKSIAVTGDQTSCFTTPCGSCRQFMAEFGKDINVYMVKPDVKDVLVTTVSKLLPYMCDLSELRK